jgi:hypothetical protein
MVDAFEGNLEKIVFVIIGNTQKRQPFCLDLVAEVERGDL